jgi:hypothetical protein
MVIPVVAAFAAGAAGVGAIATGTMLGIASGYAMVAGAVLTGVGALTGKKDLMKVGGILSLAGGVGAIANSAITAAGNAASETARQAAQETFRTGEIAAQNAAQNAATQSAGQAALTGSAATQQAGNVAADLTRQAAADRAAQTGAQAVTGAAETGAAVNNPSAYTAPPSLADAGGTLAQPGESLMTHEAWRAGEIAQGNQLGPLGAIDKAGQGFGMSDVGKYLGKTADFMERNKELVKIGGEALGGMYGPEAEAAGIARRKLDYEQSLMDRAYANLNSPVRIHSPRLRGMGG